MKVKDIFKVFIKLISLYYLFFGFISLFQSLFSIGLSEFGVHTLWIIISPISQILLFLFLFNKTDLILKLLNFKDEFQDQDAQLGNIDSKKIIKMSLLIVGLYLFADNISTFISHCFYSLKYSVEPKLYIDNSYKRSDYFHWVMVTLKLIIGYLIIFNCNKLANWIDSKQQ